MKHKEETLPLEAAGSNPSQSNLWAQPSNRPHFRNSSRRAIQAAWAHPWLKSCVTPSGSIFNGPNYAVTLGTLQKDLAKTL
eukprot:CAMPEP_0204160536 /NCGR_PEP_ID=MMETSP0361-20130328/33945_1 /ASSEMBLY_ACC=CAM_ASM_000343 /TAXON_ID=268821 /ORGANISM="Scrippsiella Hangoei, Strain SHTV-5" /LENGTH=80 /DNA_ID=CAMNT_0051116815 /DNA_START=91 /DNA_END=333 /DNA_ORIENTATION=+